MSKVDALLEQLTVEEKVLLCSGFGPWSTKKIKRLGIDPVFMSDGPHGPRWQKTQSYTTRAKWDMSSLASFTTKSGYLDLLHPVTNFPSMATLGSSWNREILYKVGKSIGEECRELGIGLLLAPGVNIVRHPLCGRSYEYLSEDPVVAGELGSSYIKGVQSTGVGATLKHFVCNNAEFERLSMDSIVEERALREGGVAQRLFDGTRGAQRGRVVDAEIGEGALDGIEGAVEDREGPGPGVARRVLKCV
jgi:beta-glucosidase